MNLSVVTFNCFSIKRKFEIVKDLCANNDIVFLQETLLNSDDIGHYQNVIEDYNSSHTPATTCISGGVGGRPSGGLSIFWRQKLNEIAKPVHYSDRIMGLKLDFSNCCYLFLNVYMPYDDKTF